MDRERLALSGAFLTGFSPECVHFQPGRRPSCMQVCDFYRLLPSGQSTVSARVSPAGMKYQDPSISSRRKVFTWLTLPVPLHSKSLQELKQAGSWRQELWQRPWRPAAWWIASCGLLSFFSPTSYNQLPRDDSAHMAWVLPHQSPVKKMSHRLAYRPVLWKHFSYSGSLSCVKMT